MWFTCHKPIWARYKINQEKVTLVDFSFMHRCLVSGCSNGIKPFFSPSGKILCGHQDRTLYVGGLEINTCRLNSFTGKSAQETAQGSKLRFA
jgi:hypothetical protein